MDTHIAGGDESVTDTFQEWAVMVRNQVGVGRSGIKKRVLRSTLVQSAEHHLRMEPQPKALRLAKQGAAHVKRSLATCSKFMDTVPP